MDSTACGKEARTMEFHAEVRRLLDIVINSLYTERDIFVRELVSNASDALEKFRLASLMESDFQDRNLPLEISISVDKDKNRLEISDTGIGMTREELVENLGTIAHSGSREFLRRLAEGDRREAQLIGQFGVGFYSVFMVASRVEVLTKSFSPGSGSWEWSSDGSGSYTISPAAELSRGTRIIITLKDDAKEYADPERIKGIIRQYSNFVPFDINVNGERVNTVQAIWTRSKSEIKDEEYNEFYKFLTNSYTDPVYRLHLSADAPIQINALFFVPSDNPERFGFGRLEPGVNLYSRKVLIKQGDRDILPEYLRFVKGVVDSEDLPLNISRETAQNSRLIKKMSRFLTRRLISFLEEEASRNSDTYRQFWDKFSMFIKEGCVSDQENRDQLARLLRFQSSKTGENEVVSLAEYTGRMKENQNAVYYLNGPHRETIESGPYLEAFRERDIEVLYLLDPVDDFVMTSLMEFQGKKLVSADQADLDLPPLERSDTGGDALSKEETESLSAWMKEVLGGVVSEVRESSRLVDSPAVVVNPDHVLTTSMQRVLQAAEKGFGGIGPKVLEINPRSGIIIKLARLRISGAEEGFLKSCVEQIADNAFLAAGLPGNRPDMIDRIYRIMDRALQKSES